MNDALLTEDELATFLSIEPRTLRVWRYNRALPHLKITSRIIRYRKSDIEAWLERARTIIA